MYIVIWEISSCMSAINDGKNWRKFDSKEDAERYAISLKKTSGESNWFTFRNIEALEVK